MKKFTRLCGLLAVLLISGNVYASGSVHVGGAWTRATAPGQDAAMVDLSITSEQSARLVAISSPSCDSVEIHSMTHANGMMKMREVQFVELPAGKRITLGESGYHLMLIGLKSPFKVGDRVALTLSIKGADEVVTQREVKADVKSLTEVIPMPDEGMHHHMQH